MPTAKNSSGFSFSPFSLTLAFSGLFFVVPLIFFPGTLDPFLIKETLAQTLILVILSIWASRIFQKNDFGFNQYPLLVPFLIYALAQWFSLKNASHPILVYSSVMGQFLLTGLYVASTDFLEDSLRRSVETCVLLASLLAGIYGALQYFGIDFISWAVTWDDRPASTFGNPNFAAGWWILVLAFFGFRMFGLSPINDGDLSVNIRRWITPAALFLAALNLYWGRTRGAWIAIALSGGVLIAGEAARKYFNIRRSISYPILLILSVVTLGWGFHTVSKKLPMDQSIRERILKWKTAAGMIQDHPLLGVGAGNLKVQFALYQARVNQEMKLQLKGTSESNVHNEYLQIAAESGILGLLAFLSIFAVWFYHRLRAEIWDGETLGAVGAVLAFLFYSFTNFPFRIISNSCLLMIILAWPERRNIAGLKSRIAVKRSILFVSLALLGFWGWVLPPFRADLVRKEAYLAQRQRNYARAVVLYEKAIALDRYRSERSAYELGECYRALGDIPKALSAYRISTELRHYGEVYNNMGNCYYLLGRYSDAVENWQKAADLGLPDPNVQLQTLENIRAVKKTLSTKI